MTKDNVLSSKIWRRLFFFSLFLMVVAIFRLCFFMISEIEEGTITLSFHEGSYEDGSLAAVIQSNLLDKPSTWSGGKSLRDDRPIEFKNTKRENNGDYIEYTVVIWTSPVGSEGPTIDTQILYQSPEFTLQSFGQLDDITNQIGSHDNNGSSQDPSGQDSNSSDESAASDPAVVQSGVEKIVRRPENEKHYWLYVFLVTALVFFTRGLYAIAFQVRRTPNWLIAVSEATFACIIALIIEKDFDLSRLSPEISEWITNFLNSLFFKITSAGVIGVILLSLVAEVFKELWNGIRNKASNKENAWQDYKNHRLSLLSHGRFLLKWGKGNRLFISNSVFLRFIIWFLASAGTFVLLILLKKDSQMLTGSLYVYLFGATIGVAGFTLHLIATQSSLLRAEFRYLSLKQLRHFFDRNPSATADYFQVLANLFISSTPIRSEEVAYHKHEICTKVLNSRFGKAQIAANLVNAYDDTIIKFQVDNSLDTSRSEYIIASRIYDMLTGDIDKKRCTEVQRMIKIACRCMFENENSKNNWRNLLSGSKTTLDHVRAISLLEFIRRINESNVFGDIDSCPLQWKCGDCDCIHHSLDNPQPPQENPQSPQENPQPPQENKDILEALRSLCKRIHVFLGVLHKILRKICDFFLRIFRKLCRKNQQPPQEESPPSKAPSTMYAALLIEFPYILALSITKKFSEKTPLISKDEMRVIAENYFFNLFVDKEAANWYRFNEKSCTAIAADVDRFFECIGEETPWKDSGKYLNRILPDTSDIIYDCIEIDYLVDHDSKFPDNYCPNLSREGWHSLTSDQLDPEQRETFLRRLSTMAWADTRFKRLSQILFFSSDIS